MSDKWEWGSTIKLKKALDDTKEQNLLYNLGVPRPKPKWTIFDRIELAWKCLRGQITWDNINY